MTAGCVHGVSMLRRCRACQREAEAACRAFDRAVFFGVYDRDGYTPAERKALALPRRHHHNQPS